MNILVLGSGGREHTFAWKIAQSEECNKLFVAPGNSGTEKIATNLSINVTDFGAIKAAVLENDISLVVVGPEDPLVQGIDDFFLADEYNARDVLNLLGYWPVKGSGSIRRK